MRVASPAEQVPPAGVTEVARVLGLAAEVRVPLPDLAQMVVGMELVEHDKPFRYSVARSARAAPGISSQCGVPRSARRRGWELR